MKPFPNSAFAVALGITLLATASLSPAGAQCTTCATPVVAYSPAVAPAATTVTYQPVTGWYPGKLLDTWRMRRWGYTAPTAVTTAYAPTYSVGYAPAYAAAYAPSYTATYAPTYTAAYTPYSVGYASAVTTASYSAPYVTSYAPLGQSQVLMRPVTVASPVVASTPIVTSACSACSPCDPCSTCAPATTVVEQATYTQAAPAPCANCAPTGSVTYADQGAVRSTETPQPAITPQEAPPTQSYYRDVTPPQNSTNGTNSDQQQQTRPDPGPAAEEPANSTYFEPPALFSPGDRTAQGVKPVNRAPSVNVWNAVYTDGASTDNVSTTSHSAVIRSQAEIDAVGWRSVPAN